MTKFVFFSKSADKRPGVGAGEQLTKGEDYRELAKIQDWRKTLSNFHPCQFKFDDKTFTTAEHAFHYAKYKAIGSDAIADRFAVESGHPIAKSCPNEAKIAAGKNKTKSFHIMSPAEQATWSGIRTATLKAILRAKFTQCSDARAVLMLTGTSELWHNLGRGSGLEHWTYLEDIRNELRSGDGDGDVELIEPDRPTGQLDATGVVIAKLRALGPEGLKLVLDTSNTDPLRQILVDRTRVILRDITDCDERTRLIKGACCPLRTPCLLKAYEEACPP